MKNENLDQQLSKYMAENIFRIREKLAPRAFEDLILLRRRSITDHPMAWWETNHYTHATILRLSPWGVFIYWRSEDKLLPDITGLHGFQGSYTNTTLPIHEGLPRDSDGIVLCDTNPAGHVVDDTDYSIQLFQDGTLPRSRDQDSEILITDIIEKYAFDYDCPKNNRWTSLSRTKKQELIEGLVIRIENAYILYKHPEVDDRFRFHYLNKRIKHAYPIKFDTHQTK